MGKWGLSLVSDNCLLFYSCDQAMQMCLRFFFFQFVQRLICSGVLLKKAHTPSQTRMNTQPQLYVSFFLAIWDTRPSNMSYSPWQGLMGERVIIVTLSFCKPPQSTLWLGDCSRNFLYGFCKYLCALFIVHHKISTVLLQIRHSNPLAPEAKSLV